jgi:polyferredoxin
MKSKEIRKKNTKIFHTVQWIGFFFGTFAFYWLATLNPIYLKRFPMPWLVCWSNPFAPGACPAGTLQHFLTIGNGVIPFFAIGMLALIGVFFGRMTCGWLCPFGLLQDLSYKMKQYAKIIVLVVLAVIVGYLCWTAPMFSGYTSPRTGNFTSLSLRDLWAYGRMTRFWTFLIAHLLLFGAIFSLFFFKFKKFTISNKLGNWGRAFFFIVPFILLPLLVSDAHLATRGPWFCKLCPAGSVFAAIPQFLGNALPKSFFPFMGLPQESPLIPYGMSSYQDIRSMGQAMFAIKISMLVLLLWVTTLSKRVFCKFACPIGTFYSFFTYFSSIRVVVNKDICRGESCNICRAVCPMDIKIYEEGSLSHCIGCLECVNRCPHEAAQVLRPSYFNFLIPRSRYTIATIPSPSEEPSSPDQTKA